MLARLLTLLTVLALSCASTPAHAIARATGANHVAEFSVSSENACRDFFALEVKGTKEKLPLSAECTKEKSFAGVESSNCRRNYLRARYMDPSRGRFLGMDPFVGYSDLPATKHRFQYTPANPITYVDPSGEIFGIVNLTFANFQGVYGRGVDAKRRYSSFERIRSNLCRTCLNIGKNAGRLHHLIPKFAGGSNKGQKLVDIPEEVHAALYRLLETVLVLNGFPHPVKGRPAFDKLFARSPGKKVEFHKLLRDTVDFIDAACYGASLYEPRLSVHLKELMGKLESLDF